MKSGTMARAVMALSLLVFAGCAADVASEIKTNAQVRDRVMAAITSDGKLAQEMTQMVRDLPGVIPPKEADNCEHVYYIWAAKIYQHKRREFVETLVSHGIPMNVGYSPLLSRVFRSDEVFPMAQLLEDVELITFDICSYDPSAKQRKTMWEIFDLAGSQL